MARKVPSLLHSKSTGQAYVTLNGHRHYLGVHGTQEAQERYNRLVALWLTNGRTLPPTGTDIAVVELCAAYKAHAKRYYGEKHSMIGWVRVVIGTIVSLYGSLPADKFGPLALEICRDQWIRHGYVRNTVNKYTGVARRIWKWGVSKEMVSPSALVALQALEDLHVGHSPAPDNPDVQPVDEALWRAVEPQVSPQVWAMIQLQDLSGARPGEVVILRPCDLETSGAVWLYRPSKHKNQNRGKKRTLAFGPKAQTILRPYMLRDREAFMFSPREAELERVAAEVKKREGKGRQRWQKPNERKTERRLGDRYTTESYGKAVARACVAAALAVTWSPNQLRHNAATRVRAKFGSEAAQIVMDHATMQMTEVYAEKDLAELARIMGEVG